MYSSDNTCHKKIKMKSANVDNILIIALKNNNDPKFKVADHVGILKYGKIFAKDYTQSWSEEHFQIKKVKS